MVRSGRLRQPASPRHFEIWYTYATGYNPSLNQMINETLARNGTLRETDIEQIYETYISPSRFTERIDRVGSQVMDEIEQVMAMIGAAAGTASSYTQNLANVSQTLGVEADDSTVRTIVESLVHCDQGNGAEQPGPGGAPLRLQAGNRPAAGEPRDRPHRKPDRSADDARQPQIVRRRAVAGDRRSPRHATSTFRCC